MARAISFPCAQAFIYTFVLTQVRWLPVRQRIKFRRAVLVYKALKGGSPQYLADDYQLTTNIGRWRLQSTNVANCEGPRTRTSLGDRSTPPISRDVNPTGTIHASFDSSVIGHSQWLPHGLGTLYHNTFRTHLLFPSSAENWGPFCSGRRSLIWSDNVLCFICAPDAQCWSVTIYWLLQTDFIDIVRWSCSSSATMQPK